MILGPEDEKIVTLARSARARTGAAQGAAVRDTDGRTYAAATVDLPSLRLSALQVAVAMAACSGAESLEAVAVVTGPAAVAVDGLAGVAVDGPGPAAVDGPGSAAVDGPGLAAVRDLAGGAVPVYLAGPDGSVRGTLDH